MNSRKTRVRFPNGIWQPDVFALLSFDGVAVVPGYTVSEVYWVDLVKPVPPKNPFNTPTDSTVSTRKFAESCGIPLYPAVSRRLVRDTTSRTLGVPRPALRA